MSDPDFPPVAIDELPEGRMYRANGKTCGPFTLEQENQEPQLDTRISAELGVPVMAVVAARMQLPTHRFDSENAPPIIEIPVQQFSEKTEAYMIVRAVLAERNIVTMSDNGEMFDFEPKKGLFVTGAETRIAKQLELTFRRLTSEKVLTISVMREIQEHLKRRTYTRREELNKDPFLLNLQNGMLELTRGSLLPHDAKYLSTVQLPVKYDPAAKCPQILKFFSEVLYEQDLAAIQELCGYVLWRDYPAAKAWMLVGTGSNGKSTYISLLRKLVGIENVSSRGLVDIERNHFATADLFGKLANLYADLEDVALRTTGKFKMLTGRDPVTAEYKYRNSFPFINTAKMVFSCNKIPESVDDTDAFFRRWIILTFPNQFQGDKEDRKLLDRLTTPEELSGFLNFALEGLKRLQANGWHFSNPRTTEEIRREYIRKSSPVQAFLMDCTRLEVEGIVAKAQLYSNFSEYCHEHQLPVPSQDSFFKKLPEINPHLGKFYGAPPNGPVTTEGKPKRVHCVKGLVVLPREEWGNGEREDEDSQQTYNSESPAHPAHPAPENVTLDRLVQGVQGSQETSTELDPLGKQEVREAAAQFLITFCKDSVDPAGELLNAGYTKKLELAKRFVQELIDAGKLGGPN